MRKASSDCDAICGHTPRLLLSCCVRRKMAGAESLTNASSNAHPKATYLGGFFQSTWPYSYVTNWNTATELGRALTPQMVELRVGKRMAVSVLR